VLGSSRPHGWIKESYENDYVEVKGLNDLPTRVKRPRVSDVRGYLVHLGLDGSMPLPFVTTNNLAQMGFCPNIVYIHVNMLGGASYYSQSLIEASRLDGEEIEMAHKENQRILLKLKKGNYSRWEIGTSELKTYWTEESWSLSFLDMPRNPSMISDQVLSCAQAENKTVQRLAARGAFPSTFRINFAAKPFFISAVPDIVLASEHRINGIIEIKSSNRMDTVYESEHDQVEFYRYYVHKRKLPISDDAAFFTVKYSRRDSSELDQLLSTLATAGGGIDPSLIEETAKSYGALVKHSESPLEEIEQKLFQRVNMLSSSQYPVQRWCKWKECHYAWFDRERGVRV